jgi:uncharacterized protein YjbJ (UPF0337 family)
MKWDRIEVRWLEYRPFAKRRWLALSDAQLEVINGRRDLLADSLQKSYGLTRDTAELEIEDWCTTFDDDAQESNAHALGAGASLATQPKPDSPDLRRRTPPRR